LENFRTVPFVQCLSRGECRSLSVGLSFWLTILDPSQQFETPLTETVKSGFVSHVSRCRVCTRDGF
jgi:hypothetical protein